MAGRRKETPATETNETIEQDPANTTSAQQPGTKDNKRKREVKTGRIVLTLEAETLKKLRHAAVEEGVDPCVIVERLLKPFVRPFVMSYRDRRSLSENETAA